MDKKDTALTQLLRKLPSGIITDEEAFIFLKMEKQQIIEAVNINYENEKDHEKGEEFYKKIYGS
jgi:hypothetical protein